MSFPLALHPITTRSDGNEPLQDLVRRINEERGTFRGLTEQQLRAEITKDLASNNDGPSEIEDVDATRDLDNRRKEVYNARTEMLRFIGYGQVCMHQDQDADDLKPGTE